ncbi:MAG: MaoC family dehydratase [Planctomycetales bacterium]|nr:MaoC family dehydratase [Planctomycetales bacterium]
MSNPVSTIRTFYGETPRTSDWFTVTQELINQFGEATCDSDWFHTDPQRARCESPYGGTIAFGFWTLSMLTHLSRQLGGADYPPGALFGINYGFDRVRFPGPVLVGSRIRLHTSLGRITPRDPGEFLVSTANTIEVEYQDKPALIADWLFLLVFRNE